MVFLPPHFRPRKEAMTEVEICNLALDRLGERAVSDGEYAQAKGAPADGKGDFTPSPSARVLASNYEVARKDVLARVRWSFAMGWALLARSGNNAVMPDGMAAAYDLPEDCLRVCDVPADRFVLGGRVLFTGQDAGDVMKISYVRDIKEVDLFDPLFVDALACRLAINVCMSITGRPQLRQALMEEFLKVVLPDAAFANKVQDSSNDQDPLDLIRGMSLKSRRGGAWK